MKIFLGIFVCILKHLLSLINKHNMSVLISSKSTRFQQRCGPLVLGCDRRSRGATIGKELSRCDQGLLGVHGAVGGY